MNQTDELIHSLNDGRYDAALTALYGSADRARALRIAEGFRDRYPDAAGAPALFSAPGRTELGGNHTDHQNGHVLCGSVDLDMLACAAPNGGGTIRVFSEGYGEVTVRLDQLEPVPEERGTTAALVRGVAAGVAALGHPVSGFDACAHSSVLAGSGLSSSAAFEVLVGSILNRFFCGGALDSVTIAKIGQRAENAFFGKSSASRSRCSCRSAARSRSTSATLPRPWCGRWAMTSRARAARCASWTPSPTTRT